MIVYFIIAFEQAVDDREVNFWMVNTGRAGGHYGTGSWIKLANTRAMVNAALDGKLEEVIFTVVPRRCCPASEKS